MKTSCPYFLRCVFLAVLIAVTSELIAQDANVPLHETSATSDAPAPVARTLPFQYEAMAKYPELGRAGSPFNVEFLARVRNYRIENRAFFHNPRWPVLLAEQVAAAGFPTAVAVISSPGDADAGVSEQPQNPSRTLLPSAPEWRFLKVYREGNDIVVPNAVATVFGWDTKLGVRDRNDKGGCASGRGTRNNPGLMGCALPVSIERRSTVGSPFPKAPKLAWFSPVVVTHKGKSITVPLIDNGPSAPGAKDPVPAGIDLTPAACLALGISLDDIRRNRTAFSVSFRLPGAAL